MNASVLPLADSRQQYLVDGRLIPLQFPYLSVLLQGRPRHGTDAFSLRHPQMERGKRAKLFAPYDALDGFSAQIRQKNVPYTDKILLGEDAKEALNRRLLLLRSLTANSRLARRNHVTVTATYYLPCADPRHCACGMKGQYQTVTGVVRRVDPWARTLTVDGAVLAWDDLLSIEAEGLFGGDAED